MWKVFTGIKSWIAGASAVVALAVPLAGAAPANDGPARSVASEGSESAQREPREVLITFEDAPEKCHFDETAALRDRYQSRGVLFTGPEDNGGGAILGDCGKFGVEGYGGYRFLAFNSMARLAGGGVPLGPEGLSFAKPVATVEVLAGSPVQGTVTLACFDEDGVPVDSASIPLTKALQPLSVSGRNIASCQIDFDASALILDNLRFTPQDPLPIPAQTPLGAVLLVLLLAMAGTALLRGP